MLSRPVFFEAVALATVMVAAAGSACGASPMTHASIEGAAFRSLPDKPSHAAEPEVVKAEVLLDRARFSPGAIDGLNGENFRKALAAYQQQVQLPASGRLDQATWDKLTRDQTPPLARYKITAADAKGPFTPIIPAKLEEQAKLRHLGYHNVRELLAEKFHMGATLLNVLNPASGFQAGQEIEVAGIDRSVPREKATRVVVDKAGHDVEVFSEDGRLLAFFPASIGSDEKPAPSGQFVIKRVVRNPDYTYLPQLHFKGVHAKTAFTIAPGPNNPVGAVWIDLSFEGYGIHGTPDPESIGKTQSHGCIRLTNWDARDLATMVDKGTQVSFGDEPGTAKGPAPATAATAQDGGGWLNELWR